MLLIRFGLQPLGWVKCRAGRERSIRPDQLTQLISQSLSLQLHDVARQLLFEPRDARSHTVATETVLLLDDGITVDQHFHAALAESYADPRVQCVFGDIWPSTLTPAAQAELECNLPAQRFQP